MSLARTLAPLIAGDVRDDPYTRHLYSSDASMYAIEPLAVAFPRDADDVQALVLACGELGVPVLPRGAGTSLAGQTVGAAVVVDFSRHMNRILEIDGRTARVQPGVVQDQLNRAARKHGLMFGPDTSTSNRATIGGMIGNNSAGSHSVLYGSTIDHVRALRVVLADATTPDLATDPRLNAGVADILDGLDLSGFPRFWRHSGGYRLDAVAQGGLTKLIVGSEGTLAVVTEATVGLVDLPKAKAIAVGHFTSTAAAIAATADALASDAASVELLDKAILDLSRQRVDYAGLGGILEGDPEALLFVEFFGDSAAEVAGRVDELAALWKANGHGYHTLRAVTAGQQAAVLKVRKAGLGLLMASSVGSRRPLAFVEDTAVPPERLLPYVEEFAAILDRHGLRAGFYGHCSVGCLHVRPFVDLRAPGEIGTMRAVAEEIADLAARHGGVNSSEHGDGLARSEFNRRLFGEPIYEAMRRVKQLFDPHGRLNPGKIVDAPPMTAHLRDPAMPAPRPLATTLSFGDGGMHAAADRCMNVGVCRKDDSGVMCPSYMATREEEHSTRGRANALVKALSSPDPRRALGDERLRGILDLCLECKACQSECPLGVDMAAMKSEFLHQYQQVHGVPPRARAFGAIRTLNRLGSATAPLSNWLAGAVRGPLGLSRRRPLPRFHRDNLPRWFARRPPRHSGKDVILLADSFTAYTEPAIGRAAVELLERAGYRVSLAAEGCCGRAGISKGLLDRARAMAADLVTRLSRTSAPIVGLEPSCLLTLKDEYAALLPGDPRVKEVAARARLIPELLTEAIDDGSLTLGDALRGREILLHGHCHEKAVTGTTATRELLSRIPGARVTELDAGCCGMAGSFGFEAEHYDLSMKIGALRLFPAIAASAPDTLLAATGVSCRQQIAHGAGRAARHPVELIHWAAGLP
ncbi:Glycolate dehydrogenase, subunit GlcD [[Actinomadura] parvosata subsp. kistnae]|uniref:FAD-binding oxidoreductase n=1 Tax=[Actinomadura] parvosata subsp. kistnae TaxID=1909395 RepID=A0A1V0A504_9ACTN|nr:FAD-binding and (Fe-S)-binding domain-containing protein [Nonomuraea sp. ATCC 55076]AQZ65306.1 FAD-binding oxidoreductase [Nonomuraea sp. ATCC 55076]SPL96624.1 Glycolate dehydrogenase, subunit GlcD [Actinomadura parvosata subsp. kistnae]